MIEKFFIQTNDTIWHFLSEIGKDKDVFSTHSGMEIDGYIIYFFATKTEVVLLCMDNPYHEDGTPEYADKGVCRMGHKPWKLFRKVCPDGSVSKEERFCRFSPIMELYNHACMMREFFALSCQFDLVPAIHLFLLTSSRIVNYSSVFKTWQQDLFGISVLHNITGMQDFSYRDIPINDDLNLEGSAYWTKWQTYLRNRGHFDWADWRYDDWPPPADKRYSWKPQKGHLISDEFEECL